MPFDSNGIYSLPTGYLAVSGQTILPSQHNPPFEDVAGSLSQVLLRSGAAPMTGILNMGGFAITNLPDAVAPQSPATLAQITALAVPPTGMRGEFYLTSAPSGWVAANGNTIGNPSSGANRANADTLQLFTIFWNAFSNTLLVIQDSSGAASVRGASAAADYAANKRLPVFDDRDLFSRGVGPTFSSPLGVTQASAFASHTHGVTDPLHSHAVGQFQSTGGGLSAASAQAINSTSTQTAPAATGISIQATGGVETRPINRSVLVCIKL